MYVSHIASNVDWWTGIGLFNTTDSAKTITITFNTGDSKDLSIPALGHTAFTIAGLYNDLPQPDIQSAVLSNTSGIVGLEIFRKGDLLSGITLTDTTANRLYYPHIASNDIWWTGIVAYNSAPDPCDIIVAPYTAEGIALTTQSLTIAGQEKYFGNAAALNLPSTAAWFTLTGECPLTGFELFGTKDGNQLAGFTSVAIDNTHGVFRKLEKDGWTGVVFVSTVDTSTVVDLSAVNDAGVVIESKSIVLDPFEKQVNDPDKIFPGDISNATHITYSASEELVGFQLNGSADNMLLDGLPCSFARGANGSGSSDCLDSSGVWEFEITNVTSSCGPEGNWRSTVTITQNECTLATRGFKNTSFIVSGGGAGDTVTIGPGNFPEDGGTTRSTFTMTMTSPTLMSGTESWTWSGSGGSCINGTADITGVKVP